MAYVPDSDANYQSFLRARAKFSGPDAADFLEHVVKGHSQLATAVTTLSSSVHATVNANAKTSTVAKKHTY